MQDPGELLQAAALQQAQASSGCSTISPLGVFSNLCLYKTQEDIKHVFVLRF